MSRLHLLSWSAKCKATNSHTRKHLAASYPPYVTITSHGIAALALPLLLVVGQQLTTVTQSVHSSYTSPDADSSGSATLLDSGISTWLKSSKRFRYSVFRVLLTPLLML